MFAETMEKFLQSTRFSPKAKVIQLHETVLDIVVKWLTLLLRILEVSGSSLGSKTGYPDWFFVVFLHQANAGIVP
jgi:hypothetical protein